MTMVKYNAAVLLLSYLTFRRHYGAGALNSWALIALVDSRHTVTKGSREFPNPAHLTPGRVGFE